ncbi:WD40 repeat-like protein [Lophiostoma macrostomum CBS 122681]|uniref:WD40 repeat-like protein n=1 Tax=Lophiostoma macrostomum CBS 122681 TaxID=1314788 RepID=A0A6A6T3I3_9PLEO|nr:WD40 repeat-like protein [Lophiostoma macrostomum CBS 122681]
MKYTVYDRLLRREVGFGHQRYSSIRGIYGDRHWIAEMDIVNELEGHNGCVNALSWSRSGRLLASGSDDHRINIHSYHPESSTSQFNLTTSILTGHRTNIFSVKFMPYSNDRTIVSATDDVRIFDIEHSGHSVYGSTATSRSTKRHIGVHRLQDGVTLTEGDTNAKAFRCHTDTVKRIVTEDNPFYFLTCSEDGDVRQWDIRQPSKTYPPLKERSGPRWASSSDASDNVPPPLISYSRYNLDLNTVSCSPSQPHYIALGGAHLHCFLHDRRMLGRDKLHERGGKLASSSNRTGDDDVLLGKATQCVKKFAPNGQQRMGRNDSGHITACKISDAHPNELVVSWSGDWIYSFDILRSPDATEEIVPSGVSTSDLPHRVKDKGRKRKRPKSAEVAADVAERGGSRQRTESSHRSNADLDEGLALRVNYGNGQSEEIRIEAPQSPLSEHEEAELRATDHFRIAKTTVKIQQKLFTPAKSLVGQDGPGTFRLSFTSALGFAAAILPEIDEISRSWRYPVNPHEVDVALQNKLRDGRASCRRFLQAAGTLARVLGGQLRTGGNSDAITSQYFATVQPAPNERPLPRHEQFSYDFLKAILLWLDSGLGALVEGFSSSSAHARLPVPRDANIDAIDDVLIPYLLHLASDDPIVDVDASRFAIDDTRILYPTEKEAVVAFARTLKVPFADLIGSAMSDSEDSSTKPSVQERHAAISQWALKVGRGVLMNACKDVRFASVDRAFGGLGIADASVRAEEHALRERQEDIDPLEHDDMVVDAELVGGPRAAPSIAQASQSATPDSLPELSGQDTAGPSSVPMITAEDLLEEMLEDDDDDSDGDIDPSEEDNEDDDVDEDGLARTRSGRVLWRSDFDRSYLRERVERHIPCSPHTRRYTGHCNVRTVKDVNFFGLDDEYVVSGSDSGHVFIWDRKTSQLVNILEGDGEVVNVIQGHPYEPTMAVSGIDHTIKIFSPDAQEQYNARKGIGVHSADPGLSSLVFGERRRARMSRTSDSAGRREESQEAASDSEEEDAEVALNGLASRKRMHQEYEITSQNDMDRKGGREDAFITGWRRRCPVPL